MALLTTTVRVYSASARTISHPSGRSYTFTAGGVVDLPELELDQLDWVAARLVVLGSDLSGTARSGATTVRPSFASARPPRLGEPFIDTTLNYVVFFVGPIGPAGTWVDYAGNTV